MKYLVALLAVVILTELSSGHKILKVEAIIIPIFQMRGLWSSMVRTPVHGLMTSYAAVFNSGLSFWASEWSISQNVFFGKRV